MKYTHNGVEYDVAELSKALRRYGPSLLPGEYEAAAALIERHEKAVTALERFVAVEGEPREFKSKRNRLGTRTVIVCPYCELIVTQDFHETNCPLGLARTALRGEESPRA